MIKGTNAINNLTENKPNNTKKSALKYIKAGTSVKVCIPSIEEVANVFVHNYYGVFNSFQCTGDDLMCKAVKYYYNLANNTTNEKEKEDLKQKAYNLKAKPRYLFGFYDLETGEPILVDLSKTQGQSVYATIQEYQSELSTYAFKLSKLEGGIMSLSPILKGLTDEEKANFNKVVGKPLDNTLYENAIFKRDEQGQIEDLKKAGFDISLLNVETITSNTIHNNIIEDDDDLPF